MCQSVGGIHLALLHTRKIPPLVPLPFNPNYQLDSLHLFLHSTPQLFNKHLLYTKVPIFSASFPPPLEALIPPLTILIWPLTLCNLESSPTVFTYHEHLPCSPTLFWLGPLPPFVAIFPTASPHQLIQKAFVNLWLYSFQTTTSFSPSIHKAVLEHLL